MKKLLFILSAIFVSVMGWAQLNPYAYGLSSAWNETSQTLTVDFKLNAKANKIEIFAVDRANNNQTYKIHEITSPGNRLDYSIPIHINGKDKNGTCLPTGKNLTFAVKVDGTARNTPGEPVYTSNRPFSPHGVAVNNCQDSQDFGAVYVTECTNGVSGDTWGWLSDKGRSVLEYNPRLEYADFHRKKNADGSDQFFSARSVENSCLEPHRVRVSEDGRIFVSSYNLGASNDKIAVWEFKDGKYVPLIYHNTANGGGTRGDRLCGMDVKGSGSNLRILLCFYDVYDGTYANSFYVYEYNLSSLGANKNSGILKFRYRPGGYIQDVTDGYATSAQAVIYLASQYKTWNLYADGFVNVSYAGANKDNIIIAIDYFNGDVFNAHMYCWAKGESNSVDFNSNSDLLSRIQVVNKQNHYYGGAGLLMYKYNGVEYALSGRAQYGEFNAGGTNTETSGRIQAYKVSGTTIATSATASYSKSDLQTRKIINDIAIDCANNVYAVSFTDGANSTAVGSGRLLAYAMPYSGTVTTYCPTSNANANKYFRLPDRTTLHMNDTDEDELNRIVGNNSPVCDCDISLYRPMQADMFNTICLPFNLNLSTLSDDHPLKVAEWKEFTGATLSDTDSGEKILTLNFEDVKSNTLTAYTPYLIEPMADISGAINIDNITFVSSGTTTVTKPITNVNNNSITFKGIVPSQTVTPNEVDGKSLTMMLVSDNRLAIMTKEGTMPGFRGYFEFASAPPQGMQARISTSESTTTDTEVVIDGQTVDVNKFLQEGRVYIRVGESLYTLDGQKVE